MLTPNGTRRSRAQHADGRGHRGRDLGTDPELVRVVRLVAEQEPVHAGLLEDRQVAPEDCRRTWSGPAAASCSGRPGSPGKWSIAMTGLTVPKMRSSASIAPSSARVCRRSARRSVRSSSLAGDRRSRSRAPVSAASSSAGADGSVTRVWMALASATTALASRPDLRAVGDDDHAVGTFDGRVAGSRPRRRPAR